MNGHDIYNKKVDKLNELLEHESSCVVNAMRRLLPFIYRQKAAKVTSIYLLDLFKKAGFILTPEFDGKSWVVVA